MNKFLLKITPEGALRVGLGVMYVYSGTDILRHPTAWYWAVRPLLGWFPVSWQASLGTPETMSRYLVGQGVGELILAAILLAWFMPKFLVRGVALLTTLEFVAILLLIPIDAITFRDFGLLGAGWALFLILRGGHENKSASLTVPSQSVPEKKSGEGLTVETFDQFMGQGK